MLPGKLKLGLSCLFPMLTCFKGLLNEARAIERSSSDNIAEALATFGACVERDINLYTEDFISSNENVFAMKDRPHEGCVLAFLERIYQCSPIANDHPFCNEENPNYNAIGCAIKLNQCLIENLTGIWEDC